VMEIAEREAMADTAHPHDVGIAMGLVTEG
jgi:hypothetical protein